MAASAPTWEPPEAKAAKPAWVPPEAWTPPEAQSGTSESGWGPPEVAAERRPLGVPPDNSVGLAKDSLALFPAQVANINPGSTDAATESMFQGVQSMIEPRGEVGLISAAQHKFDLPSPQGPDVGSGIARGTIHIADALTTPSSIGLVASMGGAPVAVAKIAGAGFTGLGAVATKHEVQAAIDAKTPGDTAEHVVGGIGAGLMTALGARDVLKTRLAPQSEAALSESRPKETTSSAASEVPTAASEAVPTPSVQPWTPPEVQAQTAKLAGSSAAEPTVASSSTQTIAETATKKPLSEPTQAAINANSLENGHITRTGTEEPAGAPAPRTPDAQGNETARTPAQDRAREAAHVRAYERAQAIGEQVASGQSDSIKEAATMAAYDSARSSIDKSEDFQFNPEFMRRSAMRAAGRAKSREATSLDEPVSEGGATRQELLPSEAKTPSEEAAAIDLQAKAEDLLDGLDARAQEIVRRHTQEGDSFDDIGADLKLSRQRVQQIHDAALDTLRKRMTEAGYEGGPGAMGPVEAAAMEAGASEAATSTKNAVMEEERAARRDDPILKEARVGNQQTLDAAEATVEANPTKGREIVERLKNGESVRNISVADEAVLLVEKVRLRAERDAYADRASDPKSTPEERTIARQEWESREAQINDLDQATAASGAEWGRLGQFRQRLLREDFTLEAMERRARVQKGDSLTPEESAKIKEQAEKIQKLNEQLSTVEKTASERAADKVSKQFFTELMKQAAKEEAKLPKIAPRVLALAESIVSRLDTAADAARLRIRERLGKANAAVDPTVVYDVAVIGLSKLGHASLDFAKWSAEMTSDLGEWVKPHLVDAWKQAEEMWKAEEKRLGVNAEPVRRVREKAAAVADAKKNIVNAIKERVKDGDKLTDLRGFVQKLALQFVREGTKTRNELWSQVHEVLKDIVAITPEQTRDLISGYGDFKPLSTDAAKVTLRGLKGELQQVAKLQDMEAKQAPKKTGVERRTPTDEERALIKQVNEAKKKGGFTVTDPAKQLKSALDAIKTRLNNDIRDMDLAIATREPIANRRESVEYDAETKTLKAQRDAKKAEYDAAFPKQPKTEAEQIAAAGKALDRSIADLEKDMKEGKLYGEKPAVKPTNSELEAKRARLEELRAQRDELRLRDTATLDERSNAAYKSRTARAIADMQRRMAAKDFTRKLPREFPLDKEATDLKFKINEVKRAYTKDRLDYLRTQRSAPQKVFEAATTGLNTARAIQTSIDLSAVLRQGGFIAIGNPVRAAKAFPAMFKALRSEKGRFAVNEEIQSRPNAELYKKAKLYLHDPDSAHISALEEAYMTRFSNRIPGVAASERAYTTFLNRLRADSFDALVTAFSKHGVMPSMDESKALANYVNVATGRGNLGSVAGAGVNLNALFFSPRYVVSRFELAAGSPLWRGTNSTRKLIAAEYGKYLAGVAVIYALSQAAGGKVGYNPNESDFGKIRFGNTRIDPLSGLAQVTVFKSRAINDLAKTIKDEKHKYGSEEFIWRFIRSKLNPALATAVDLVSGKTVVGEKVTLKSAAQRMIVPLSVTDIYDNMKENGVAGGTALSILTILGVGVQNYQDKHPIQSAR